MRKFVYFWDESERDIICAIYTKLTKPQIYKIVEKVKEKNPCDWQFCDITKELCKKDKGIFFCTPVEKVYI